MSEISVPRSFLLGKIISQDIVNEKTGEILFQSNTEITEELLEAISGQSIIFQRYTPMRDQGAYISDTLTIDTTGFHSGCSGRDIPNDASGRSRQQKRLPKICLIIFFQV